MRVVILGASGFLGTAISVELAGAGHEVVGVSRSRATTPGLASVRQVDVVAAAASDLDALVHGADAVVHALGPDDRAPLPRPVAGTLGRLLVAPTVAVAHACRRQGVGALVVLGSYFATFDRLHPQWRLADRHPYVRARVEQTAQARAAVGEVAFSVLEIPFVFGAVPGVVPMWRSVFFDLLRRSPVGLTVPGSSAAVAHTDVSQVVRGLVEGRVEPGRHPVVVDNISYRRLSRVVLEELGRPRRPVLTVPGLLTTPQLVGVGLVRRARGLGSGLTPSRVAADVTGRRLDLDPAVYGPPVGLAPRSIVPEVRDTVRAAYPERWPGSQTTRA